MKKAISKKLVATLLVGLITSTTASAIGSQQKPPESSQSTLDIIIAYFIGSQQKPPSNP